MNTNNRVYQTSLAPLSHINGRKSITVATEPEPAKTNWILVLTLLPVAALVLLLVAVGTGLGSYFIIFQSGNTAKAKNVAAKDASTVSTKNETNHAQVKNPVANNWLIGGGREPARGVEVGILDNNPFEEKDQQDLVVEDVKITFKKQNITQDPAKKMLDAIEVSLRNKGAIPLKFGGEPFVTEKGRGVSVAYQTGKGILKNQEEVIMPNTSKVFAMKLIPHIPYTTMEAYDAKQAVVFPVGCKCKVEGNLRFYIDNPEFGGDPPQRAIGNLPFSKEVTVR